MARKIEYAITANPEGFIEAFDKMKESMVEVEEGFVQLKERVEGLFEGGFAIFGAAWSGEEVVKAAVAQEAALKVLDGALLTTQGHVGEARQQLLELAEALEKSSTFEKNEIISSEALLLRFREIGGDVFPRAQQAAVNLASALGIDLQQATEQVGRALNDPLSAMRTLRRDGILLTQQQHDQVQAFAEAGEIAKAQIVILDALDKSYGGAAEAAKNTLGGALKDAKHSFDDLLGGDGEGLGGAVSALHDLTNELRSSELKEGFANATQGVITLVGWLAEGTAKVLNFAGGMGVLLGRMRGEFDLGDIDGISAKLDELKARRAQLAQVWEFSGRNEHAVAKQELDDLDGQIAKLQKQFELAERMHAEVTAAAHVEAPKHIDIEAEGGAGHGSNKHRVQDWDAEIERQRTAFDMLQAQQGTFHQFSIQAVADYWQQILNRDDLSTQERLEVDRKWLAAEQQLRQQASAAELADFKLREDRYKNDVDARLKIAQEELVRVTSLYGQDSAQYRTVADEVVKIEREKSAELLKLAEERIKAVETLEAERVNFERQMAQLDVQAGAADKADVISAEQEFENRLYGVKARGMQERLTLLQQDPDHNVQAIQQTYQQIEQLATQHTQRLALLQRQAALEGQSDWRQMTNSLSQTWATGIGRMLQGTLSWHSAMRGLWASLEQAFVENMVVRPMQRWIEGELSKTAATAAGVQARVAAEAEGGVESLAISVLHGSKEIMINAYKAMAAAWSAISAIPYVGPFLAPAVAVATFAGVAALVGKMASAAGGYDIPSGVHPITQLHQQEMVLPAHIANPLRSAIAAGSFGGNSPAASTGAASGSGNVANHHSTYNIHISATDAASVEALFTRNGSALVAALHRQARQFAFPR